MDGFIFCTCLHRVERYWERKKIVGMGMRTRIFFYKKLELNCYCIDILRNIELYK